MGFLDYGLAAKAFADGFRQTYITDAEREKQRAEMQEAAMQNKIRQAQLEVLAREQANDAYWKKSFTNPILGDIRQPPPQMQGTVGQGLLAIKPNPEFNQPTRDVTNLMGLLLQNASPYERAILQGLPNMSAKEGATLLSTILRNREDNTTRENWYNIRREMDDWRRDQRDRELNIKEKDLDRKERSDQNKAVLAALRANGSSKDTEFDKIYNSYVEQYLSEVKQGLHKGQPHPMPRWQFKRYMNNEGSNIPEVPIAPTNPQPTNKIPIPTWNPKTKKFE